MRRRFVVWTEGLRWWAEFASDLRYALRGVRRQPGFALAVVLTLGLGVGANAAMFGIVDRLLLRAPAFLEAPNTVHRVVFIETENGAEHATSATSYRRYLDLVRTTSSFDAIAAVLPFRVAVGTGRDARELPVQLVTSTFWRLFDASPVAGRFFGADADAVPAGSAVAVLSYGYWQSRYGARADVAGQRLRIGAHDFTIVGVAPKGFTGIGLEQPVAYVPFAPGTDETGGTPSAVLASDYGWAWLEVFARRRPGVTTTAATADLTHAYQLSSAEEQRARPQRAAATIARLRALAAPVLRDRGPLESDDARLATWLLGVASVVLLIACANVGNLFLARGFSRRREIAVRLALGGAHRRLLKQLFTESAVLAVLGGGLGIAIAQWGGHVLGAALVPAGEWTAMVADRRVLVFAGLATLVATILSGFAPAYDARRTEVATTLRTGSGVGAHRSRLRAMLLLVQMALSVVLLAGAGLFVWSAHNARTLHLGFDPARVSYVRLEMRGMPVSPDEGARLREALVARARAMPGVEEAARTLNVPFRRTMTKALFVDGIDSVSRLGRFDLQAVSPGYFLTMGTRILSGRPITAADRAGAAPVMLVSQSMARALWPGKNAIGQCVRVLNPRADCRVVVGVVEDIHGRSLRNSADLTYYVALDQFSPADGGLFVRTRSDAADAAEAIRRELQALMPGESYIVVNPFAEILEPSMRSFELGATMFTAFGGLAALIAAIGLYSVVAYTVAQRTREIGVRMAIGAGSKDVILLVLGESLRVAATAGAIGIIAVLGLGRWVGPLLFGISPQDPRVLGGVAAGLLLTAALASLVPAWRAAHVDPNSALRTE